MASPLKKTLFFLNGMHLCYFRFPLLSFHMFSFDNIIPQKLTRGGQKTSRRLAKHVRQQLESGATRSRRMTKSGKAAEDRSGMLRKS
jgi:hypothetical protein